jgi:transcriptional regulator with XRE-family HTH domain
METTGVVTGDELRRLRAQAGISLRAMADKVGCSPEQLAYIELGEHPVEIQTAVSIVRAVLERLPS